MDKTITWKRERLVNAAKNFAAVGLGILLLMAFIIPDLASAV